MGKLHLTAAGTTSSTWPTDLQMDPLYLGILDEGIFKTVCGGDTSCPLNPGFTPPEGCPDYSDSEPADPFIVPFDHVEIEIFPVDSGVLYASFGICPAVAALHSTNRSMLARHGPLNSRAATVQAPISIAGGSIAASPKD